MKKVTKYESDNGQYYDTKEEALRADAYADLQEFVNKFWDPEECCMDTFALVEGIILQIDYVSQLVNQIKENTPKQ